MKFLKEEEITKENKHVKITFKGTSSTQQAALITLAMDKTLAGKVKLTDLILKNILSTIEVNRKDYDPVHIANHSDLSDPSTVDVFFSIAALVMEEMTIHAPVKKKSTTPDKPTDQKKDVVNVQIVKGEDRQDDVSQDDQLSELTG